MQRVGLRRRSDAPDRDRQAGSGAARWWLGVVRRHPYRLRGSRQPHRTMTQDTTSPSFFSRGARLQGLIALVTGAGQGIGAAIALRLAEEGADIALNVLKEDDRSATVRERIEALGRRCLVLPFDVTDRAAAAAALARAWSEFGALDVLVNNAGIERHAAFLDVSEADYDAVLDVNLKAPFFLAQAFARRWRDGGRGGKIINISSVHEELPFPNFAPYCRQQGRPEDADAQSGGRARRRSASRSTTSRRARSRTPINERLLNDPALRKPLLAQIPLGRLGKPAGRGVGGVVPGLGRCRLHHRRHAGGRRRPVVELRRAMNTVDPALTEADTADAPSLPEHEARRAAQAAQAPEPDRLTPGRPLPGAVHRRAARRRVRRQQDLRRLRAALRAARPSCTPTGPSSARRVSTLKRLRAAALRRDRGRRRATTHRCPASRCASTSTRSVAGAHAASRDAPAARLAAAVAAPLRGARRAFRRVVLLGFVLHHARPGG